MSADKIQPSNTMPQNPQEQPQNTIAADLSVLLQRLAQGKLSQMPQFPGAFTSENGVTYYNGSDGLSNGLSVVSPTGEDVLLTSITGRNLAEEALAFKDDVYPSVTDSSEPLVSQISNLPDGIYIEQTRWATGAQHSFDVKAYMVESGVVSEIAFGLDPEGDGAINVAHVEGGLRIWPGGSDFVSDTSPQPQGPIAADLSEFIRSLGERNLTQMPQFSGALSSENGVTYYFGDDNLPDGLSVSTPTGEDVLLTPVDGGNLAAEALKFTDAAWPAATDGTPPLVSQISNLPDGIYIEQTRWATGAQHSFEFRAYLVESGVATQMAFGLDHEGDGTVNDAYVDAGPKDLHASDDGTIEFE